MRQELTAVGAKECRTSADVDAVLKEPGVVMMVVNRQFTTCFAPSSPSIGLFRDGKLVYMVERRDIEQRNAEMIADLLTMAFDKYCTTEQVR